MRYLNWLFYSLLFFSFTIFVCSCHTPSQKGFSNFETIDALPIQDTLKANTITISNQTQLLHPFHILNINDEYLLISEQRPSKFIHVFSLPALKFLYDWGKQGRGPNEFMRPPRFINVKNSTLILYDNLSQSLQAYSVHSSGMEKDWDKDLSYEGQLAPLNRVRRLTDSLYIADYGIMSENTNHEYVALRPNHKDTLFTFSDYPQTELERSDRYFTYIKSNISKPDGSKFAGFYYSQNKFKIYNNKGKLIEAKEIHDPYITNGLDVDDILYRQVVWASDNLIYCLGLNESSGAIYENPKKDFQTSFEIWNWEGEPIYRAKFDRLINGLTVSEKYSKLYAFSSINENEIYEFDIAEVLNLIE